MRDRRWWIPMGCCVLLALTAVSCKEKPGARKKKQPAADPNFVGAGLGFKHELQTRKVTLGGHQFTLRVPQGWEEHKDRDGDRYQWSWSCPAPDDCYASLELKVTDVPPKDLSELKKSHDPARWKGKQLRMGTLPQRGLITSAVGPTGIGAAHGRKETHVTTTLYRPLDAENAAECSASFRRSPKVKQVEAAQRMVEGLCLALQMPPGARGARPAPRPRLRPSPSQNVDVPAAVAATAPAVKCTIDAAKLAKADWDQVARAPELRTLYLSLLMERCRGFAPFVQASFNVVLKRHGVKHEPVPAERIRSSFKAFWEGLCPGSTKAFGAPRNIEEIRTAQGRLFDHCKLGRFKLCSREEFMTSSFPGYLVPAVYWSLRRGGMAEPHARGLARVLIK